MSEKIKVDKDASKELNLLRKYIDEFKFDEASQLIKNFEELENTTLYDQVTCHLLNCELLLWQGLYEDLVKLAKNAYKKSLGLGKKLLSVDIILIMANALLWLCQYDKLQDAINLVEELLKSLTQKLPTDYKRREAYLDWIKGRFYLDLRDADRALKLLERSLTLRKEYGTKREIAISLGGMSRIFVFFKVDYERGIEILEEGKEYY